jgi:hypothetical protein
LDVFVLDWATGGRQGKQSLFEGAAPEGGPKTFSPFWSRRVLTNESQRRQCGGKSFFASFSLRGAFAVALSQKEDSSLPATCLAFFDLSAGFATRAKKEPLAILPLGFFRVAASRSTPCPTWIACGLPGPRGWGRFCIGG